MADNNESRTPEPVDTDPDLLARWIGVAGLLASAEEPQTRRGGAWPGLALVTADTADEAILGMIAASGTHPPTERDHFDQVYALALGVLKDSGHEMPHGMRARIIQTHRSRNLAVHLGAVPAQQTVQTALRTAAELRAMAIDALEVLEAFRDSGPVRAVAELVSIDAISGPLAEAERLLREEKVADAADHASIALHQTLQRVSPGLRSWHFRRHLSAFDEPRTLVDNIRGLEDRADRLEAWILATGIGLRPRELWRLQRTLGEPTYTMGGPQPHSIDRHPKVELTQPLVEWALLTTADVVYRLWQDDSLRLSDEPWDEEEG